MDSQEYKKELDFIFNRFPSYQTVGKIAYKPGIETMLALDEMLGHPHRRFETIHVAGTNGKGSTSHMLAAALQLKYKVGLYTSPHLADFRERIKVNGQMVPQEYVYTFLKENKENFIRLGASFFEITTALAFAYFAAEKVDIAVIECGLGGRLDSTNIVTPRLSIITNIGLDHCEHLGFSLHEIAAEKGGIIKNGIPVVIGERDCKEVEDVFLQKARLSRSPIFFAEDIESGNAEHPGAALYNKLLMHRMDLEGDCQDKNIKTVSTALGVLFNGSPVVDFADNICNAAKITGLRGRWETLSTRPLVICDTGHNAHGFEVLGPQIKRVAKQTVLCNGAGRFIMVFGVVADKDLDHVMPHLPYDAHYYFVNARGSRAMDSRILAQRMCSNGFKGEAVTTDIATFLKGLVPELQPDDFVFVGGSTFVVAEALEYFG